jgi:streptogramin lyase
MRLLAAAAACVIAVTTFTAPAAADAVVDGTFPVSSVGTNNQIAAGPDGNMWVTLDSGTNDYARITPSGTVTEFNAATVANPVGLIAGPDGNLWVTQNGGVAKFSPANPTAATATAIADIADPRGITVGPDGNLWTASADKVIKIPPANPAGFTPFAATGVLGARWITSGTDGNLWVADFGGAQIVRVTPAGVGTTFATGGGPQGVAAGPNGQVAFSNQGANPNTVGRITTAIEVTATPGADPFGVTLGSDGAYWFAQFATNDLGRLTSDGAYTTLAVPAGSGPRQLAAGPNNTLWVTYDTAEQIGRVSGLTAPPTPTPTSTPTASPTVSPTPSPTVTAPTTTLTKVPKKRVTKAKVRFRFTGTAGATFQCRLDKRSWAACTSPKVVRVKPGKHVFRVRAVLDAVTDPTPAVWRFKRR